MVLILIAIVLAVPFVLRAMVGRPAEQTEVGAGGEAGGRLVIVTPHDQSIRREFARAFDEWHRRHFGTGASIDYRSPGGTNDILRLLETTYRSYRGARGNLSADGPAGIDLAWGGGDYFFDKQLKPAGILQPMHLTPGLLQSAFPEPTLYGVKLYDTTRAKDGTPTPQWVGVCLSSFGIIYNPDVYAALGLPAPQRWGDLADPRLAGMVALADPSHSASAGVAYEMVIQRAMADSEAALFARRPDIRALPPAARQKNKDYTAAIAAGWKNGMSQLVRIAANARYFTDSSSLVPNDVANGQAAAGVAIDFYAKVTAEVVGPGRAAFVTPRAATAITPDPVAMLAGVDGPSRELAEQFVEFLLSPEGQKLWILKVGTSGGPVQFSLHRMPIRRDVYADRSGWSETEDPFTTAGGFNERGEWMALYGDTIPIWDAAWINSRDSLEEAYDRVLQIPDPARRSAILDKLADLPIGMADLKSPPAELRALLRNVNGDPDATKAIKSSYWTNRFAEHYRQVAQASGH
ncbi:MAG TPA: extracellular solute-binding protein [Tepidisphaeraceae bacterium]|nr:extracellular solute-binding protein [Tepidisphaeraceae bacterium]